MAHIINRGKNKDGQTKWQISIEGDSDPVTGKRNRKYKTVHGRKSKAEKVMAKMITKMEHGTYVEPSEMTVRDLLDQWLESYCKPNLQPRSYDSYKMICTKHLDILGSVKLKNLKPIHIQNYQTKKLKELSSTTVQNHHHILSQALKYGIKMQLLENNPAEVITAPPREDVEMNYLNREDVKKALKAAEEKWIYPLLYVAINTGMRRGELLGLEWKNVDLENRKISVVQSLQRIRNKGLKFKKPKTKSSKRMITISNEVVKVLKKLKQKQNKLKLRYEKYYSKRDLVFSEHRESRALEPCNPFSVTRRWNRISEEIGRSEVRLHDLRHTHATLLLTAGVNPKVVQERLGHKKVTTTLDTYSHVTPTLQKEAADKIDSIISS
jgi:integrase